MSVCKAGVEVYSEFAGYKDTDKETGTDGGTGTGTTGTTVQDIWEETWKEIRGLNTMNYKEWVTRMLGICWWIRRQRNEAVFRDDGTDRATCIFPCTAM